MIKFHLPIDDPDPIIESMLRMVDTAEEYQGKDMGLIYIDSDALEILFSEHLKHIKEVHKKDYVIIRGWVHFMKKGSERKPHLHSSTTGLYYLKIPENSGKLYFDDTAEFIDPVEGDFHLFGRMLSHGITEHRSEYIRLAIAMELEEY